MSVLVMAQVFARYPVGGGEMLLALAIADHASDDGTRIFPTVKRLADKTRQSERTVQYQLRKMEQAGWLVLVEPGSGGRGKAGRAAEYRIPEAWIKGAEIAPFPEKGATDDRKGCNQTQEMVQLVAPQPSGIIIEPSREKARKRATPLPEGFTISPRVREWAAAKGYAAQLADHLEHFVGTAKAKGYTYLDWDEAFMGSIRADWGDVRKNSPKAVSKPAMPTEWWLSQSGILAKGGELGLQRDTAGGEHFAQFKCRVFAKAGDGVWLNTRDAAEQRLIDHYRREGSRA